MPAQQQPWGDGSGAPAPSGDPARALLTSLGVRPSALLLQAKLDGKSVLTTGITMYALHVVQLPIQVGGTTPSFVAMVMLHTSPSALALGAGMASFFAALEARAKELRSQLPGLRRPYPRAIVTDKDTAMINALSGICNRCRCVGEKRSCAAPAPRMR